MTDQERLHEAIIKELEQKALRIIAVLSNEYLLGNFHGRLIAFAPYEVVNKKELDRFHDKSEAAGLQSIKFKNEL